MSGAELTKPQREAIDIGGVSLDEAKGRIAAVRKGLVEAVNVATARKSNAASDLGAAQAAHVAARIALDAARQALAAYEAE